MFIHRPSGHHTATAEGSSFAPALTSAPARTRVTRTAHDAIDEAPAEPAVDKARFRRLRSPSGVELIRGHLTTEAFPVHTHDEYTVVAVERGHARFLCGRSVCTAVPGMLVLIEPGVPHTGGSGDGKDVCYRAMQVPKGVFEQVLGNGASRPAFPAQVVADPSLSSTFVALHARLLTIGETASSCGEVLAVLGELLRRHGASEIARPEGREPRRIRAVREHLAANLSQVANLDALSDLVGVSPFYLQRTFKAATRMSPREYQMDLRIRRARELLRQGLSPRAVAGMVGFFDQSHFTRAFRKLTGITPGQYAARPTGGRGQSGAA